MSKLSLIKYSLYQTLFLISSFIFSPTTFAQLQLNRDLKPDYLPDIPGTSAEEKIQNFSGNFIVTLLQISGGVAVILIIYNGFQYIKSRGDDGEIDQAKTNITWIIGGLVLLMVSYVVVRFVIKVSLIPDELN
jgi:hypothetical protein